MNKVNKIKVSGKWLCVSGILLLLVGCHKPESPEYYGFTDLRIGKIEGQQTTIATTLKMYNPNSFGVQFKHAEMDVLLNGKPAGHSVLDTTISIPRKDTFYIPVTMNLDLHSILSNALQLFLEKQVKIALDGRVRLKRGGVPFSVPFHYEGNQDLSPLFQ